MKNPLEIAKQLFALLKPEPIRSQGELLEACTNYAVHKLKHTTVSTQRDAEVTAVRESHEHSLLQIDAVMKHEFKRIKAWALANRKEVFGGRQTFLIAGNELEFHQSPGAVKTLDELEDEDVVERILSLPTTLKEVPLEEPSITDPQLLAAWLQENEMLRDAILRISADLDKKAIARLWRQSELNPALRKRLTDLGLRLESKESFSFTPALVELPANTAKENLSTKEAA